MCAGWKGILVMLKMKNNQSKVNLKEFYHIMDGWMHKLAKTLICKLSIFFIDM